MIIDKNEFFRQATLRICVNLNIESAMRECLVYLRAFMSADVLHMILPDKEPGPLYLTRERPCLLMKLSGRPEGLRKRNRQAGKIN